MRVVGINIIKNSTDNKPEKKNENKGLSNTNVIHMPIAHVLKNNTKKNIRIRGVFLSPRIPAAKIAVNINEIINAYKISSKIILSYKLSMPFFL
jgi:hypothetical protein